MNSPYALIILDGFGYRKETKHNAIAQAHTPMIDYLLAHYPHTLLHASGKYVGLPAEYMGNSEVGHVTIGAGRIIKQPLTRINEAISNKSFFDNPTLVNHLQHLKKSGGTLHLMGLLSDAGVHSHEDHLYALIQAAHKQQINNIVIHAFLDGRDTPPKSAKQYLLKLDNYIGPMPTVSLGSIHGRYYAMDRDNNWNRTQHSLDALTKPTSGLLPSWQELLKINYENNITDEFIPPAQIELDSTLKAGDGVIMFNFRPDRSRQLHEKLSLLPLSFILTMVPYEKEAEQSSYLFANDPISSTLLDTLKQHNKSVFAIAETEKYAHITYFFGGGREEAYLNETRVLIPSIKTKSYAQHPCMSAAEITSTVVESLHNNPRDFYLINYANADMVGHSGDMQATIKAVECVDQQLKTLYKEIVKKRGGTLCITADHGNAECMYDEKNHQPSTRHTNNQVYFILVNNDKKKTKKLGLTQLADITPFILKTMGLTSDN